MNSSNISSQTIVIQSNPTYVRTIGHGPRHIMIIHGWGVSGNSWLPVAQHFSADQYTLIIPDMPGFGHSPAPAKAWSLDKYRRWILELAQKLQLQDYTFIGHSFGGRIGITLTSITESDEKLQSLTPKKLILCAAAGIKDISLPKQLKRKTFAWIAKTGKLLLGPFPFLHKKAQKMLYRVAREHDYEKASPVMKKIMTQAIEQDLSPLLTKIKIPTLILWGEKDTFTPLQNALKMHRKIPNNQLITFPDEKHNFYKYLPQEIAQAIQDFINEKPTSE